ncbi:MAG: N-acetyltransferase [Chitinophagales bacterium]|nr:N-acetyltransferase [Chitinophagales bacterium]
MKEEFINIPLVNNEEESRFEIKINNHYSFIEYRVINNLLALIHTETQPELAGTGAATAVVEKTLQYVDENDIKILPYCPFILAYIKKHPEWKKVVDKHFRAYDEI